MFARTKILCTIGPAVQSLEKILELIDAGMNGARLNFSHGTHEQHRVVIENLKKAREIRGVPLSIVLDTKGPEIRLGQIVGGRVALKAKQKLLLVKEQIEGDDKRMQVVPGETLDFLKPGSDVLFDDGYVMSKVVETSKEGVWVEILNDGVIQSKKKVNIPHANSALPAFTEEDRKDIIFGCEQDIDIIAASFIRSADHVLEIKRLLAELGRPETMVVSKIETRMGVDNFDEILQVSDGIMVARGDLGVEIPLEEVPYLQKMMINKCASVSKLVITATQMLESMITNPRPTRAEVSDVANAIYDSTSAVMLSAETATGQYPIEAVKMMRRVIIESETKFSFDEYFNRESKLEYHDLSSAVAVASAKIAYMSNAKGFFVFTSSGLSARRISRLRPKMPILALSFSKKSFHQLALDWGIVPVPPAMANNSKEAFSVISRFAMKNKWVEYGDLVIVTMGTPFGVSGTTNLLMVESIGDVLVRGHPGPGKSIHANVAFLLGVEKVNKSDFVQKIVVLLRCDPSLYPLLEQAAGIVLQNHPQDFESEKHLLALAEKLHIPVIYRVESATALLKENQPITLDPERGIIYKASMGLENL